MSTAHRLDEDYLVLAPYRIHRDTLADNRALKIESAKKTLCQLLDDAAKEFIITGQCFGFFEWL